MLWGRAMIREKAKKCYRLAATMPPGPDAEMMKLWGKELTETADQLENIEEGGAEEGRQHTKHIQTNDSMNSKAPDA
jgi:hypothetical protein